MNNIIIGNGFDLSLGLKTSYKDFLESNFFESLIIHRNSLARQLKNEHSLNNWVDIENEISKYSKASLMHDVDAREEFEALKKSLIAYLAEAQKGEIDTDSSAFKMIKNEIKTTDSIFNFNYTNSVFRVLDAIDFDYKKEDELHFHVHGSIEKRDIILGVEDKADIQLDHIFFKKSYNLNFGKSPIGYLLKPVDDFVLFGHSLGITDSSYFLNYFRKLSEGNHGSSDLTFYYHGKSGYFELMKALDFHTKRNLTGLKNNNDATFIDSFQK